MILSYESLFEKWLQENSICNIISIGKNLKNDREGFLYQEPQKLLELASKQNDTLVFFTIINFYEPLDLEGLAPSLRSSTHTRILEDYCASRIDNLVGIIAEDMFNISTPENPLCM